MTTYQERQRAEREYQRTRAEALDRIARRPVARMTPDQIREVLLVAHGSRREVRIVTGDSIVFGTVLGVGPAGFRFAERGHRMETASWGLGQIVRVEVLP
jgi:hypothetical protein